MSVNSQFGDEQGSCEFLKPGTLVPYSPPVINPLTTPEDPGGYQNPGAQEVLTPTPGNPVTTVLSFRSQTGKTIDVELEINRLTGNSNVTRFVTGGIGHTGIGQNSSVSLRFKVISCGSDGNPVPVNLAVRPTSFQVAAERWHADGTGTQPGLTPVDLFLNANGTVGTYPATGIFGTSGSDQAARLIGYENRTEIRADWFASGSAGSAITLFLYGGPEVYELDNCEAFDQLTKNDCQIGERVSDLEAAISGTSNVLPSSAQRIGRFDPVAPIDANNTTALTGFNLLQEPHMFLKIGVEDLTNEIPWNTIELDVDGMLEAFNTGATQDGRATSFDNDFLILNIVDPATGEFVASDSGRQFKITWMELWAVRGAGDGFRLISPNGTEYDLTVDDSGTLTTTAV